jgi:hypothetical protein
MPIVIARDGPVQPVVTGIAPERRAAAWAHIVGVWAERNPDRLRDLTDKPTDQIPAGNPGKEIITDA